MSTKKRKVFSDINITPLTDIFLVLLIIMMVVAPLLDQQGLNLVVPDRVEAEQMQQESKILSVVVDDNDNYLIGDEYVELDSLKQFLKENKNEYPDGLMIMSAANSTHGAVVKLMDEARSAGFLNISIKSLSSIQRRI